MANVRLGTESTDAEVDAAINAALAAARQHEAEYGPHPAIARMEYLDASRILIFHLRSGARLPIPLENLQGLGNATPEQLCHHQLLGPGTAILFPDLNADFHIDGLLAGIYGDQPWMASLAARLRSGAASVMGSQSGASRSKAKTAAARANGTKGGRPRKEKVPA